MNEFAAKLNIILEGGVDKMIYKVDKTFFILFSAYFSLLELNQDRLLM
mgnify:CR=1 FL=1